MTPTPICRWPAWLAVVPPMLLVFGSLVPHPAAAADSDEWVQTRVPEAWKNTEGGEYAARQGFRWYRCWIGIPESWQGRDVALWAEAVDDAREFYFNGALIGTLGSFPPAYRSGLGSSPRFPVPASAVHPGQANLLAVRVCLRDGRGGFNVAAPVLFGGGEAIRLAGTWQERAGDDRTWAVDRDASPPSQFVFHELVSSTEAARDFRRLQGDAGPLPPQVAQTKFVVADDLRWELCLAEPDIAQPLCLRFDARGRLWVVEYRQYPNPAGLKPVSRDQFLRTVYDTIPAPPPHHVHGADRISIHEDTNGDGVYDRHTVFVDGLNMATSLALGRNGVWVLNPPYLLFYPDANHDDVPDGDPEVHLEGFGLEDSHSLVNSLRWGPDGWLYAAQGSTVSGNVRCPGTKQVVHSMGQLIWRYQPETHRYEIFAEGGGNTFGVELDAMGRIYSGHNGGDTRGFHYVQGGYYLKGFGKHGALSNPFAFGYCPAMKGNPAPRFTHTFVIYEGGALPAQYAGHLFGVAPLQSHIVCSEVLPDGSSFQTRDVGFPVTSRDPWFRPVDIQVGPDGAIYVADFYEQRIDHASHYQGRIDTTNGRVYRLTARAAQRPAPFDLARCTSDELVDYLAHPNKWFRQTALQLLADRRDPAIASRLWRQIQQRAGSLALESLWALNVTAPVTTEQALVLLEHPNPYVRLWTVRLLCDTRPLPAVLADRLADRAAQEDDVEVRSQLASSARRLPAPAAMAIVGNLLRHDDDLTDVHIPLLLWWAIESKCGEAPDDVLSLLQNRPMWDRPIVQQHVLGRLMRRFAQSGRRQDLIVAARLLDLAPTPDHARILLAGFEEAFQGRTLIDLPQPLVDALARTGGLSLTLRARRQDPQALAEALQRVADSHTPSVERVTLVGILGEVRHAPAVPWLLKAARTDPDMAVRKAALSALQVFPDPEIGAQLVESYGTFPKEVAEVAQSVLASRQAWAGQLLAAVDKGRLPPSSVGPAALRQMLLHPDPAASATIRRLWGEVAGATTAQMQQQIARYSQLIQLGSGNPYAGKALFAEHCGKCHRLFGEGGQIGPDLTSFQRDDLARVLLNVVNPSFEIREGFESYALMTRDGRTLNGFLADQDNRVMILRSADGQVNVVPRDEIEELRRVDRSVMPEGILSTFNDQQVRDLFAYVRASQPIPQ